ncbi:hypothetical protein ACFS07_18915 [Undibacterium arcticum]
MRMLDEPANKQYAVEELNLFIVENYLVVSHVAAIRLLLRRHAEGLPKESVDAIFATGQRSRRQHAGSGAAIAR